MTLTCEVCGCSKEERERCADAILRDGGYRPDGLDILLSAREAKQLRFEQFAQKVPLTHPDAKAVRLAFVMPPELPIKL